MYTSTTSSIIPQTGIIVVYMYGRCHQRYYLQRCAITRCFIFLGSIFASTGLYLRINTYCVLEHYYYSSAVLPHALHARVVIVYRCILVLVRAHVLRIIFNKKMKNVNCDFDKLLDT